MRDSIRAARFVRSINCEQVLPLPCRYCRFGGIHMARVLFMFPAPAADVGGIFAVLVNVFLVIDERVAYRFLGVSGPRSSVRAQAQ